jgi:dephospho-CoA kinase
MRRQSGEEEKRKKRLDSAETGSEKGAQADVLIDNEIDPADFIDPDEFGFRRKYASFDP